jgi:hypothetical protein
MDKPLHVQVAKALGWIGCVRKPGTGWWGKAPGSSGLLPLDRFDKSWSATGRLIEKYGIDVFKQAPNWKAVCEETLQGTGTTPLIAVCNLILALSEAGKLRATTP